MITVLERDFKLDIDDISRIEPYGISNDGSIFSCSTGRTLTNDLPELPCLSLVGWENKQISVLQQVQKKFREARMPFVPDIVIVEHAPSWEFLVVGASYGFEAFFAHQSRITSQMSRDLYELRRQHDKLQDNFSSLEEFFYSRRVSMVEESFIDQPMALIDISPGNIQSAAALLQLLPVSTKNISAFALHSGRNDPNAKGLLKVELRVPETNETLWSWQVGLAMLPMGWAQFGMPSTLGGLAKSAVLRIRIEGDAGSFRLSVGALNPLRLYQLSIEEGSINVERALAMRVFVSPPGIVIRHDGLTIMPLEHGGEVPAQLQISNRTTLPLGKDLLLRARRLSADGWFEPDFETVVVDTAQSTILVHPTAKTPAVALIPECIPADAVSIAADIFVDHESAGIIGFRLGVVWNLEMESPMEDFMRSGSILDNCEMSEWTFLGPGRRQSISLDLKDPLLNGRGSLVLVTKLAEGTSPDFAWSKFADFRFDLA